MKKTFEARDEYSGFGSALEHIFQHQDIYKIWASTLIIAVSLFWFNVFWILQQYFKHTEIKTLLFKTPLEEIHKSQYQVNDNIACHNSEEHIKATL